MAVAHITTHHKAIDRYYEELAGYRAHYADYEQATRAAFEHLLTELARPQKWTLILEQPLANGKRPDGTLRDEFNVRRGYWEAKDTRDDLETELRKKLTLGYPTTNTLFEDTHHAILYQSGRRIEPTFDLTDRRQLVDLLRSFLSYEEPVLEDFYRAVSEFKERIPDLAKGLLERITAEHSAPNPRFRDAWGVFYQLCRSSINPNIRHETVDEMLVQHLLTERLFRTVFDNPDFVRRNVIASEIERVIDALTSRAFNRADFLRSLDRFYLAIESEARSLSEWADKQSFLNTVYERFFQGYSVRDADTHGIVYTPQEIVDFMCASVEEALRAEFGVSLSAPGVQILDPATGTGSFIVNLIRRIGGASLEHKYRNDLFANEIMLLPYYIASLNIEHAYYERMGQYLPFEGIAFADTLDLEGQQMVMFSEHNTERITRQKEAAIRVIIGNPPYNMGQQNENDNNQNRKYPIVDKRIHDTYAHDSKATLNNKLYDAYVKFFRWATDRLQGRDGIVCYVSNNSFVDQLAFDGMRKHLLQDFTQVYHLDLHGNVRKNPKLSGTTHNVFGIQVGVGVTIAIRSATHTERKLYYYRVPEDWRKERKWAFLTEKGSLSGIAWQELQPDDRHTWLTEGIQPEFVAFLPLGTKDAKAAANANTSTVFKLYSLGVVTNRDSHVYSFDETELRKQAMTFVEIYNSAVDIYKRRGESSELSALIDTTDSRIKWTRQVKASLTRLQYSAFAESYLRNTLYRPFTRKKLYFDDFWNEERYKQHIFFPTPATEAENTTIVISDHGHRAPFSVLATNLIPDLHLLASTDAFQCFPFYTYDEDGSNRRENITDWALAQFQAAYGASVTKRAIFAYVYALLHHPTYCQRYAENLKRDLPRIPLLASAAAFTTCVEIGEALLRLHLDDATAPAYPLHLHETPNQRPDWRVERKMRLTPDKTALIYNDWLTLEGIPPETFAYRLGNRSALEWIIDQYHVSVDTRSGITSDPNRPDDPQYILRLLQRIITISLQTTHHIATLTTAVDLLTEIGSPPSP